MIKKSDTKKTAYHIRIPILFLIITPLVYWGVLYFHIEINQFLNLHFNNRYDYANTFESAIFGVVGGVFMRNIIRNDVVLRLDFFFDRITYQNFLKERKIFLAVLYVGSSLLFSLWAFNYFSYETFDLTSIILTDKTKIPKYSIDSSVGLITMIAFFPMFNSWLKRDLKFRLARICYRAIDLEKTLSIDKIRYLVSGTELYNSFLNQTMNLQIRNLEKFYSKVLLSDVVERDKFISEMEESFSYERISPAKKIAKYTGISDKEDFLIRRSLSRTLKEIVPIITTGISSAIVIITFVGHLR